MGFLSGKAQGGMPLATAGTVGEMQRWCILWLSGCIQAPFLPSPMLRHSPSPTPPTDRFSFVTPLGIDQRSQLRQDCAGGWLGLDHSRSSSVSDRISSSYAYRSFLSTWISSRLESPVSAAELIFFLFRNRRELLLQQANTSPSQTSPCSISRYLHRTTTARARFTTLGSIRCDACISLPAVS
jgi:hypothetical protein